MDPAARWRDPPSIDDPRPDVFEDRHRPGHLGPGPRLEPVRLEAVRLLGRLSRRLDSGHDATARRLPERAWRPAHRWPQAEGERQVAQHVDDLDPRRTRLSQEELHAPEQLG